MMKTQFGRPPKIVKSDQGGEYTGSVLRAFYKREGIRVVEKSVPGRDEPVHAV